MTGNVKDGKVKDLAIALKVDMGGERLSRK